MVDRQKLGAWIQPQHLEDAALEQYRKSFTSHPARLVVIKDFLPPQVAERLSRFLSSEAEFKAEYGLYSIEGAVKEEDWLHAKRRGSILQVRKVGRDAAAVSGEPEVDIRNPDTYRSACEGVDHVLHHAALGSVPDEPVTRAKHFRGERSATGRSV
jgi:hypothetical protein